MVEEDDRRAGELLAEVRRDGVQFRGVALVDVGPDVDEDYAREPPGGDEGQPGQAETPERALRRETFNEFRALSIDNCVEPLRRRVCGSATESCCRAEQAS